MTIDDTLEISYYLTSKGYQYINNVSGMSVYFHPDGGFINVYPNGKISVYELASSPVHHAIVKSIKYYFQLNNLAELVCKGKS